MTVAELLSPSPYCCHGKICNPHDLETYDFFVQGPNESSSVLVFSAPIRFIALVFLANSDVYGSRVEKYWSGCNRW